MNRAQRRMMIKGIFKESQSPKIPMSKIMSPKLNQDAEPDFSDVPLSTVCQSIWLLINELRNRGYPVYDFDHKEKSIQSIKIIRNKVYFLAMEETNHGEKQAEENRTKAHG